MTLASGFRELPQETDRREALWRFGEGQEDVWNPTLLL